MGRYDSRGRDLPTSLLIRNIPRDCRSEDLRRPFGRFGSIKDIYLPTDYYTGEPRGFGFVQYMDPVDAAEAKYYMDRQMFQGREITVVFAEERRKKPDDMRRREIIRHRVDYGRHYSPGNDVRSHLRSQSPAYYSPHREPFSRSYSPDDRRYPGDLLDRRYYDGDFHSLSHLHSRSLSDRPNDSYGRSPGRAPLRSRSPPGRLLSYPRFQ